jgi:hypothetical protein
MIKKIMILLLLAAQMLVAKDYEVIRGFGDFQFDDLRSVLVYDNNYYFMNSPEEFFVFKNGNLSRYTEKDIKDTITDFGLTLHVHDIILDKNGDVLLRTLNEGVVKYDWKKWYLYNEKTTPIITNSISGVAIDENNKVFVLVNGIELYFIENNILRKANFDLTEDTYPGFSYYASAVYFKGDYYYPAYQGYLCKVSADEKLTKLSDTTYADNTKTSRVAGALKVHGDELWFTTNEKYIIKFDGTEFTRYNWLSNLKEIPDSLKSVVDMEFDKNGKMWILLDEKGPVPLAVRMLYRLDMNGNVEYKLNYYDLPEEDRDALVSIVIDKAENGSDKVFIQGGKSIIALNADIINSVEETETIPNIFISNIFPNPTADIVKIRFYTTGDAISSTNIKVYNYLGNLLNNSEFEIEYNIENGEAFVEVNLTGIGTGLLFIAIENNSYSKAVPVLKY